MESQKGSTTLFDNNESYYSSKSDNKLDNLNLSNRNVLCDTSIIDPPGFQHLQLDFTPDEEIDNDYVQKKCCEFWHLIHSTPEIKHLMVTPEKNAISPVPSAPEAPSETSMIDQEEDNAEVETTERNALSMLDFVTHRGLVDCTFKPKIPRSQCTLGSREYKELLKCTQRKKKSGPCYTCVNRPGLCTCNDGKNTSVTTLTKTMEDWDEKHPKSMEPPSHPAPLQQCILQGKVTSDLTS